MIGYFYFTGGFISLVTQKQHKYFHAGVHTVPFQQNGPEQDFHLQDGSELRRIVEKS